MDVKVLRERDYSANIPSNEPKNRGTGSNLMCISSSKESVIHGLGRNLIVENFVSSHNEPLVFQFEECITAIALSSSNTYLSVICNSTVFVYLFKESLRTKSPIILPMNDSMKFRFSMSSKTMLAWCKSATHEILLVVDGNNVGTIDFVDERILLQTSISTAITSIDWCSSDDACDRFIIASGNSITIFSANGVAEPSRRSDLLSKLSSSIFYLFITMKAL